MAVLGVRRPTGKGTLSKLHQKKYLNLSTSMHRNCTAGVPLNRHTVYLGTRLLWNSSNLELDTSWRENFVLVLVRCLVLVRPTSQNRGATRTEVPGSIRSPCLQSTHNEGREVCVMLGCEEGPKEGSKLDRANSQPDPEEGKELPTSSHGCGDQREGCWRMSRCEEAENGREAVSKGPVGQIRG